MRKNKTELTDLIEMEYLQAIQDAFASLAGIVTLLVNADAQEITLNAKGDIFEASTLTQIEKERYRNAVTRRLCMENRKLLGSAIISHADLVIGAVPIFLDNVHLGSWILGTDSNKPVSDQSLIELGTKMENLDETYEHNNRHNYNDEFELMFHFLESITQTVVELARVGYTLKQTNVNLLKLTDELEYSAQMLSKFTNSADVGMCVADYFTGEILQANECYARFRDLPLSEIINTCCWQEDSEILIGVNERCPRGNLMDEHGNSVGPVVLERYIPEKHIWLQFINQAIYWVDGSLAQMITFTDITQVKQMQEQLAHIAYHDRSMQLPNATKFLNDLSSKESSKWEYILCFDIMSLRTINDAYGRWAGTRLLEEIAIWVKKVIGFSDVFYRIEGDEFAAAIDKNGLDALEFTEIIKSRFESSWNFTINEESLKIYCNVNVVVVYLDDKLKERGDGILNLVERTFTHARENGGLAIYNAEMDQEHKDSVRLDISLRSCIKQDMLGFEVHYQPIVSAVTHKWCGLEALCRWKSPDFGDVPPLIFIRQTEQMGLISILGRWVLETAIKQCKLWKLDDLPDFFLDVNLSPNQMTDETLADWIVEILNLYDFPGKKLSLEITESTKMNFTDHSMNTISSLRNAGIMIALDDFGTGYSSFNNLKQLPVSILKTERIFLNNIENDTYLQYLFYMIIELAHAADKKLVAEGVEYKRQLEILLKNGVDYLQGYIFSVPLPAAILTENLESFFIESDKF